MLSLKEEGWIQKPGKARQTWRSQSQIQVGNLDAQRFKVLGAVIITKEETSEFSRACSNWLFISFRNSRGCFLSQSALRCWGSLLTDCTGPGMLNKYLWGEWLNDFNFGSSPSRHQQMFRESKLMYFPLDIYKLTDITNRMWRQGLEQMWLFIKIKAKWGSYRTLEVGSFSRLIRQLPNNNWLVAFASVPCILATIAICPFWYWPCSFSCASEPSFSPSILLRQENLSSITLCSGTNIIN